MNKYISTKDAVRLTGLSTQEIYDLIHNGTLSAHKAPKSGWRILQQDLEELGLIQNESDSIVEEPQMEDGVAFVADEEHYTEVFKRMTEVKSCLCAQGVRNSVLHSGGVYETFWLLFVRKGKLSSASGESSFRATL